MQDVPVMNNETTRISDCGISRTTTNRREEFYDATDLLHHDVFYDSGDRGYPILGCLAAGRVGDGRRVQQCSGECV
jgi:hypothetical protein